MHHAMPLSSHMLLSCEQVCRVCASILLPLSIVANMLAVRALLLCEPNVFAGGLYAFTRPFYNVYLITYSYCILLLCNTNALVESVPQSEPANRVTCWLTMCISTLWVCSCGYTGVVSSVCLNTRMGTERTVGAQRSAG